MSSTDGTFVPALRFSVLTSAYDRVVRLTSREDTFRSMLIEQSGLRPGLRVLDIGCGTGSQLLVAKETEPEIEAVGIDGDPKMLKRAAAKAEEAGVDLQLDEGMSFELPYPDDSFDRVLSSLFFHHLTTTDKIRTITEVARVLKPGGELHVADWGPGSDPLMKTLFWSIRLLDGREQTEVNANGKLPALFAAGGLKGATMTDQIRTPLGSLAIFFAQA